MNGPDDRTAWVTATRRAADLIEAHPDFPTPVVFDDGTIAWSLYSWECPDGVPAMVAAIRRAVGGKWDKREQAPYGTQQMVFEREGYAITTQREAVCVRRVVGTETVVVPAVEAQPEQTIEREIVEWDCAPILTDGGAR